MIGNIAPVQRGVLALRELGRVMRRLASTPAWNEEDLGLDPESHLAKKFQRILSAQGSEQLQERLINDPDEALVRQSQNGDPAAFEPLIHEHQRMIYSLTYRMTGSVADAEDLTQEAFIRAYRQIGAYRFESKFSTWLYRIALNVCLKWRQRETLRVKAQAGWVDEEVGPAAANGESPARHESIGRVQAALLKLPGKQRAAVLLTVYDGLNHAEAAKILGCSETTVSWRVFVARRKLKSLLRPERP